MTKIYDNSCHSQQLRLLKQLKEAPITTQQCRKILGIFHPSGRIKGLREKGYKILTMYVHEADDNGILHRIAKYILMSEKEVCHEN